MLAACYTYEPIDYTQYTFRCDTNVDCPSPQQCIGGICQYTTATRDGVQCGSTVCNADQQCCWDGVMAFCTAPTEDCRIGAVCDGVEDCPSGTMCCPGSYGPARCIPGSCDDRMCVTADDCGASHNCCPYVGDPRSPLHECLPLCPTL